MKDAGKGRSMRKLKKNPYLIYTAAFVFMLPFVFGILLSQDKSFVFSGGGDGDGISQHYTALAYFGQWLREILYNIAVEHRIYIPMWDMSIGYGADIITTLSYYVIGDPFALLSVFCPKEQTEILYCFLILLRLWCAGAAFLFYCRYMRQENWAAVLGALIYIFSAYPLRAQHPYFINPMIWFPLILTGAEKIFHRERPYLYIGVLAVSAISNFYFFYMICIMAILYAVFRYFMVIGDKKLRTIACWVGKFMGYSLWAVGIAMVLLLPTLLSLITQKRIGVERDLIRVYPVSYYREFLGTMIAPTINAFYTYIGVSAITVLTLVLCILDKKDKLWKWYFGTMTMMLLIPWAGHVMNGFAYVTNRWIWAYIFLIAFITVQKLPQLLSADKRTMKVLTLAAAGYIGVLLVFRDALYPRVVIGMAFLVLFLVLIWVLNRWQSAGRWGRGAVFAVTVANLVSVSYIIYSPQWDNYVSALDKRGEAWANAAVNPANSILRQLADYEEQYRYDTAGLSGRELMRNSAMLKDFQGTSFYFSTTNENISQFYEEMYMADPMAQSFENLEERSFLAALASVKYCIVKKGDERRAMSGFSEKAAEDETYAVYEDVQALPMAYSYDGWIPREYYENMSVAQRQEAVLQGAVLDEAVSLPETVPSFSGVEVPFKIAEQHGLEYKEGEIIVRENNASMILELEGLPESETYVVLDRIHYDTLDSADGGTRTRETGWRERLKSLLNYSSGVVSVYVSAMTDAAFAGVEVYTPENSYYCGREDFLCNLGFQKEAVTRIQLNFSLGGIYHLDGLSVVCQPTGNLSALKVKLGNDQLKLEKVDENEYVCQTDLEEQKIVCFSVPYSAGWTATLDGEAIPLLRVNTMYMGVEMPEGRHEIRLYYRTPGLIPGAAVTLICVSVYFWCIKRKNIWKAST